MTNKVQIGFWPRTIITLSVWTLLLLLVIREKTHANPGVTLNTFMPILAFVAIYSVVHLFGWVIFKKLDKKSDIRILVLGLFSGVIIYCSIAMTQGMFTTSPLGPTLISLVFISIGPIWDFRGLRV